VSENLVSAICRRIATLNEQIANDSDLGEGFQIGHSFFCAGLEGGLNAQWYHSVVHTEIAPLLKEYWFDKRVAEIEAIIASLTADLASS